ncbi:MAG TPA: DUF1178 family protein [Syntrophales bacterium]|nr:DUF1178 family protein [Syntrophales bacterium]HON24102.1 DUF1178 family protein [Syntrophales bacterium]HOU77298.1 DUF1178 family protein [Syntrophales bacterium]HPC33991.1 DUF1178 family protein [Syntrophales bacterium]HQG35532.1 DUF1178 family protein [Syntrophales bacterium]
MIVYDLRCARGHKFEGWFQDRQAFADQKEGRLISCPVCGSMEAEIVPAAVNVVGRDARSSGGGKEAEISPVRYLEQLQQQLERYFDNVGDRFAEVAFRIHRGEEERRNIRGTTTQQEEEALREEGVPFVKIPLPKFDS